MVNVSIKICLNLSSLLNTDVKCGYVYWFTKCYVRCFFYTLHVLTLDFYSRDDGDHVDFVNLFNKVLICLSTVHSVSLMVMVVQEIIYVGNFNFFFVGIFFIYCVIFFADFVYTSLRN